MPKLVKTPKNWQFVEKMPKLVRTPKNWQFAEKMPKLVRKPHNWHLNQQKAWIMACLRFEPRAAGDEGFKVQTNQVVSNIENV